MPGDVEFLDAARFARSRQGSGVSASTAASYVRCAEDALQLLPGLTDLDERTAVCRIAEAWLALAETELAKAAPHG